MISERLSNLEAVDGAAALAESGDDVLNGDGAALGVLSVRGGITDDGVSEGADARADLAVDGAGDALDATAAGEAADGALGDAGGVALQDLLDALAGVGLALGHFVAWFLVL